MPETYTSESQLLLASPLLWWEGCNFIGSLLFYPSLALGGERQSEQTRLTAQLQGPTGAYVTARGDGQAYKSIVQVGNPSHNRVLNYIC